MEIFETPLIAGNTTGHILLFFFSILSGWIGGRLLKAALKKLDELSLKKGKALKSVTYSALAASITPVAIAIGIKIGFHLLILTPPGVENACLTGTTILVVLSIVLLFYNLVDIPAHLLQNFSTTTSSTLDDMLIPVVRKTLRLTIVLLGMLHVAQILSGKELSTIVAGLGLGGLAFALAAQDTIKNFFGSIVLFSDKPFELGERINIDGHDGTVEEVGLRSTRIRRLDGHLVTIPNGELANKAIWNIAKRPFIRNLFTISVTYDTPPAKLKKAKAILEGILENHEGMNEEFPPRVYFQSLNSHSLDFLVIYWYHPPEYWNYMAFTERVNLEIVEQFNAEGIEFAFPTQTIHLQGDQTETPPEINSAINPQQG